MVSAFLRALTVLKEPAFWRIVWRSILIAIAAFIGLYVMCVGSAGTRISRRHLVDRHGGRCAGRAGRARSHLVALSGSVHPGGQSIY